LHDSLGTSPSFRATSGESRSYEIKFLVDPARAESVRAWARDRLSPDPNGDAALGGSYVIHTLYLDTAGFDVYRRTESFRRRKFRARRYGESPIVHLEQKTRSGDRVSKRRTAVGPCDLAALSNGTPAAEFAGAWFRERVAARRLVPAARITYLRTAFVGSEGAGTFRLTLDDRLEAARGGAFPVESAAGGSRLLDGQRVLELKYQPAMPAAFKDLVARLGVSPVAFSKYRLAVDVLGLARPAEPAR
jgi:hypothetical protein